MYVGVCVCLCIYMGMCTCMCVWVGKQGSVLGSTVQIQKEDSAIGFCSDKWGKALNASKPG